MSCADEKRTEFAFTFGDLNNRLRKLPNAGLIQILDILRFFKIYIIGMSSRQLVQMLVSSIKDPFRFPHPHYDILLTTTLGNIIKQANIRTPDLLFQYFSQLPFFRMLLPATEGIYFISGFIYYNTHMFTVLWAVPAVVAWSVECLLQKKCHLPMVVQIPLGAWYWPLLFMYYFV